MSAHAHLGTAQRVIAECIEAADRDGYERARADAERAMSTGPEGLYAWLRASAEGTER